MSAAENDNALAAIASVPEWFEELHFRYGNGGLASPAGSRLACGLPSPGMPICNAALSVTQQGIICGA